MIGIKEEVTAGTTEKSVVPETTEHAVIASAPDQRVADGRLIDHDVVLGASLSGFDRRQRVSHLAPDTDVACIEIDEHRSSGGSVGSCVATGTTIDVLRRRMTAIHRVVTVACVHGVRPGLRADEVVAASTIDRVAGIASNDHVVATRSVDGRGIGNDGRGPAEAFGRRRLRYSDQRVRSDHTQCHYKSKPGISVAAGHGASLQSRLLTL
jgi:hypothetical protein